MTSSSPVTARFESEFGLRVGPLRTDYKVMQPGETVEVTEALRAFNRSGGLCLFDVPPEVQRRDFGRVIVRVGSFPQTSDPNAERWYAPLDEDRFAEIDGSIPKTNHETIFYGPSW